MKDLVIIGAGGFGREVQWLIERINAQEKTWNLVGYIDDGYDVGTLIDELPVIGNTEYLISYDRPLAVVCAIGSSKTRKKIIERICQNPFLEYPNMIDPSVLHSKRVRWGIGNIVCAYSIVMVDIDIGDFNIVNLDSKIGHDDRIGSFVTINPSVNVSGNVRVGDNSEIGTGCQIIQGKTIAENVIIGAGAVVTKDLLEAGTYVGVPAKKIK